jgi:membrane fusion protein (multidrug efflux system)
MKMLTISLGILFLLLTSCSKTKQAAKPDPKPSETVVPVKVRSVVAKDYQEFGEYFGLVYGTTEARLVAYGGGRVSSINVKSGDAVKKDQRLCNIDGDRFEIAFNSAQLAEKIAKQNADRAQLHLKRGSTSRLNVDRAQLEYLKAKSMRVEAEKVYKGAFCISPIDGIVVDRHIELYQDLSPGQPSIYIASIDKVNVHVGIPESAIDGYQVGSEADVLLNNYPDKVWSGSIFSIAQSVREEDRTFEIQIEVPNEGHLLKPGLTARTRILKYKLNNKIVIPSEVILTKANGRVVMVSENGIAKARKVSVQSSNAKESLIASGLNIGDQLIVSGQSVAVDGSPLELVE